MPLQFSVLASGSRGNATLVRAGGAGLLIDAGLGPRRLGERLARIGQGWEHVSCVLLTHTHSDHVDSNTLHHMAGRQIKLICHEGHRPTLSRFSGYHALANAGLTRSFDEGPFLAPNGLRVEAIRLQHDGGPTFGFRLEGRADRRGKWTSLGYLADTGSWTESIADALTDVDLLGVEFNHDVDLQRRSGRSWHLIRRILGEHGHLSNEQGADLVSAVLARSRPGALRHLVLLHLSQDCNLPELAVGVARKAIRTAGRRATVTAAEQHEPWPDVKVMAARRPVGSKPGGASGRPTEPAEVALEFAWD